MNPIFRIKKFEEPNLGNYLRAGREKMNLTLNEASEMISISSRHLKALEENDYSKLPPVVYTKGIILQYCKLLELDADKALYYFGRNKLTNRKENLSKVLISHAWLRKIFSYRNFAIFVAVIFLITCIFYISKAIYPMYAKPFFILADPSSCPFQTNQDKIEIKGLIQPESKIWINEEDSLVDKDGKFSCFVFLNKGENFIRFRVLNKFGKESSRECVIYKN